MGDRVLVTFTDDGKTFTPAIYMHWCGHEAPQMIRDAAARIVISSQKRCVKWSRQLVRSTRLASERSSGP